MNQLQQNCYGGHFKAATFNKKILHAFRTHVIQPVELAGMIYLICVIALSLCIVWFKHIQYTNGIQKKAFRLMHANLYPIISIIYMC